MRLTVAVLGLGEAGGRISRDLAAAGAVVRGFDPRVPAPDGVHAATGDGDACRGADLVLSLNSAHDAVDALRQGLAGCHPGTIWADLNTAAPRLKEELATVAAGAVRVVDVALMAPVPGKGLHTPMTVSGPAAQSYADALGPLGATIEVLSGPVGVAATRKLLRSVFYKGMAAAILEAVEAARAAGLAEWLEDHIREELDRTDEMAAATDLLDDLGVPPRIAAASRDWLADLAAGGSVSAP